MIRTYNVDLQVKVLVISQWFHRGHLDAARVGLVDAASGVWWN